jgi:alpha-galactosidase
MTLWCICRSPLIIGGNLPANRELENALLTNPEVLAVDQQGIHPRQLYQKDSTIAWCSQVPGTSDRYVALFNSGDKQRQATVELRAIGLGDRVVIRDLWARKDLGPFIELYLRTIPPHGAALLRISSLK